MTSTAAPYQMPIRRGGLVHFVVDYVRSHPKTKIRGRDLAKKFAGTHDWHKHSYGATLGDILLSGGPVERVGHGVYQYDRTQDGPDWLNHIPYTSRNEKPEPTPSPVEDTDYEAEFEKLLEEEEDLVASGAQPEVEEVDRLKADLDVLAVLDADLDTAENVRALVKELIALYEDEDGDIKLSETMPHIFAMACRELGLPEGTRFVSTSPGGTTVYTDDSGDVFSIALKLLVV